MNNNKNNQPKERNMEKLIGIMNFYSQIDWEAKQLQKQGKTRHEALSEVFKNNLPPLPTWEEENQSNSN
jgi:hypothetical protein